MCCNMLKNPHGWISFATELEVIKTLQICFSDFEISHISRAQNKIYDSLARTAMSFHRDILFYWLLYSSLVTQTTSSLSDRIAVRCKKKTCVAM